MGAYSVFHLYVLCSAISLIWNKGWKTYAIFKEHFAPTATECNEYWSRANRSRRSVLRAVFSLASQLNSGHCIQRACDLLPSLFATSFAGREKNTAFVFDRFGLVRRTLAFSYRVTPAVERSSGSSKREDAKFSRAFTATVARPSSLASEGTDSLIEGVAFKRENRLHNPRRVWLRATMRERDGSR